MQGPASNNRPVHKTEPSHANAYGHGQPGASRPLSALDSFSCSTDECPGMNFGQREFIPFGTQLLCATLWAFGSSRPTMQHHSGYISGSGEHPASTFPFIHYSFSVNGFPRCTANGSFSQQWPVINYTHRGTVGSHASFSFSRRYNNTPSAHLFLNTYSDGQEMGKSCRPIPRTNKWHHPLKGFGSEAS